MESETHNLQTLEEEGLVGSDLGESQNPCGQSLEEKSGLIDSSELCGEPVLVAEFSVAENNNKGTDMEVAREVINVRDSSGLERGELTGELFPSDEVVREETQVKEGSVIDDEGVYSADVSNKNFGPEVTLWNGDTVASLNRAEPGKVSGNCLSLFAEVFGSLDGIDDSIDDRYQNNCALQQSDPDKEDVHKENEVLLSDDEQNVSTKISETRDYMDDIMCNGQIDTEANNIEREVTGERDFAVGDLVWVKKKTQLWWPATVYDPSLLPKDGKKSDPRGCFVVKCFEKANLVWCSAFELKPFIECFGHMSKQNSSRSFQGAVEKAIREIGRRVKLEMTCTCFSKGRQKVTAKSSAESNLTISARKGETIAFGASAAYRFEPASFVTSIRDLAINGSAPGKIELIILRNYLSAFYSSVGHLQLPMYQLRPGADDKDGVLDYLPPNPKDREPDELFKGDNCTLKRCESDSGKGTLTAGTLMLKSEEGRGDGGEEIVVAQGCKVTQEVELSSTEFVEGSSKGRSADGYESRRRKKSKYLSYPYVDLSGCEKNSSASDELGMSVNSTQNRSIFCPETDKSSSKYSSGISSGKLTTGCDMYSNEAHLVASSTEMLFELRLMALHPYSDKCALVKRFFSSFRRFSFLDQELDSNEIEGQQEPSNSHQTDTEMEETGPQRVATKHRRKQRGPKADTGKVLKNKSKGRVADSVVPDIGAMAELLDLNGNSTRVSLKDLNIRGTAKVERKRKRRRPEMFASDDSQGKTGVGLFNINKKSVSALNDVEMKGPHSSQSMQLNGGEPFNGATSLFNCESIVQTDAGSNSLAEISQKIGFLYSVSRPRKKRKEKNSSKCEVSSAIPDLNANAADQSPSRKDTPGVNSSVPEGKPKVKRRRRRKKSSGGAPDINANGKGVLNHDEARGTLLLLNFDSGYSLPSKESLLSTFSAFGTLKEMETQFLNDSGAQIAFVRSSDAVDAFRSLEKSNPLGPVLASFHLSVSTAPRNYEPRNNLQMTSSSQHLVGSKTSVNASCLKPQNTDTPDLSGIRQNLEMMTSMLEKAGDNISPEMRAKLENDINSLMKKISNMTGS